MSASENSSGNRWWEFYFVRYFIGTVVGAIVVLALATNNSGLLLNHGDTALVLQKLNPVTFNASYITILGFIGLTFCYIASAPILVFHAVRGSLLSVRSIKNYKFILVILISIAILTALQYFVLKSTISSKNLSASLDANMGLIVIFATTSLFVFQVAILGLSIFKKETISYEYYHRLVQARANDSKSVKEYVESYRHLREHGNAFFITFLEILLGASLHFSPVDWWFVIAIWIAPGASIWVFATIMEERI